MRTTRLWPWALLFAVVISTHGCSSAPKAPPPPPPTIDFLSMTVRTGGVHHCTLYHDALWYQSFDSRLLVLDPENGLLRHELNLGQPGAAPPVVDMLVYEDSLYVVLEAETVIRIATSESEAPAVAEVLDTKVLGVRPYRLSVAGDRLFASGFGGVVDLNSRTLAARTDGRAGPVVAYAEGLATTVGRRAIDLLTGEPIGSATTLFQIPESLSPDPRLIGVRQLESGALVSLMNGDVREIATPDSTISLGGAIRAIRFIDDRMWVINDEAMRICRIDSDGIAIERTIDVLGARDVARRDESYLLVSGVFGRAVYREHETEDGPADHFTRVHREPSGLVNAVTDGRYILAGGPLGHWRYLIGQTMAELNDRRITQDQSPSMSAQMPGVSIHIVEDGAAAEIEIDGVKSRHVEPDGVLIRSVYALEGRFWIGHDHGITVLRARPPVLEVLDPSLPPAPEPDPVVGRLRFEGPVRYIYPLATGRGAVFVSAYGGFGVGELIKREVQPMTPVTPPR